MAGRGDGDGRLPARTLWRDERASAPGDTIGLNSTLGLLLLLVLGGPFLVALIGGLIRRERAVEYTISAAAALVAAFALTGVTMFADHWTVLGILGILAAVSAHLWQYRLDRVDLLIVGGIYAVPIGLAAVLLIRLLV